MSESAALLAKLAAERLDRLFMYHAPTPDQLPKYEDIRARGRELARVILELCPPGEDREVALRKVREAVMTANASVALRGLA